MTKNCFLSGAEEGRKTFFEERALDFKGLFWQDLAFGALLAFSHPR